MRPGKYTTGSRLAAQRPGAGRFFKASKGVPGLMPEKKSTDFKNIPMLEPSGSHQNEAAARTWFTRWRARLKSQWHGLAKNPKQLVYSLAGKSLYCATAASALYPVLSANAGGDPHTAMLALSTFVGSVGTNLIANAVQNCKDEAEAASRLESAAEEHPEMIFGDSPVELLALLDARDAIIADLLAVIRIAVRADEIDLRQVALIEALQKYDPPIEPDESDRVGR